MLPILWAGHWAGGIVLNAVGNSQRFGGAACEVSERFG